MAPDTSRHKTVDRDVLLQIYRNITRLCAVDEGITKGLSSGRFAFNYWPMTGQEGIPAALAPLLTPKDFLVTTYRGVHDYIAKGVPLRGFFAEAMGRADGINKGKGGLPHVSHPASGTMLTTAIVGSGAPIANGLALAAQLRGTDNIAVVSFGDGASSIGAVHEAMNLAGAWGLPVIFLLQNNQIAEYTLIPEYTRTAKFVDRAQAYGITGLRADGNDAVDMYLTAKDAVNLARTGKGPVLLEAVTLRLGPHSGAGAPAHLSKEKLEAARQNAPKVRTRTLLLEMGCEEAALVKLEQAARDEVEDAIAWAVERPPTAGEELFNDVYDDVNVVPRRNKFPRHAEPQKFPGGETVSVGLGEAIRQGIDQAMAKDPTVLLMGEDVHDPQGGVFGTLKGLQNTHGKTRVRSTPIAEQAIIGAGIGAALAGMRPICEIMFIDFIGICLDQISNHAAKQRYQSGGASTVPMTIRMMLGPNAIGGLGATHSQSLEACLLHIPGVKVVYPSTPWEAKGLLRSCVEDDNPCVILESIKLLFQPKGLVPVADYKIPIGLADIKRKGKDATVITYGWQVHEALAAAEELAKDGINIEVLDLRSLMPLDYPTILESVRNTKRALVVTAATEFCGLSGEIASTLNEQLYRELDAPVHRYGAEYVPIAIARPLENAQLPRAAGIAGRVRELMKF
jgi:2-oxoisovalerate dehydrogenase E1 component